MSKLLTVRLLLASFIILVSAIAVIGATYAFLTDLETSEGNTFDAGILDLKIDNTSYYNGQLNDDTTWTLDDLTGHLFFDFNDVKPGDWGEDTISIHVETNDAFACFDTTLTTDNDSGTNNLELASGDVADTVNDFDGELGQNINFIFWADDGDNVFEDDETDNIISTGPANTVLANLSSTLADSVNNMFGGVPGDPLDAETTYYIAKAWCFGTLGQAPLLQDELGAESPRNPSNSTGGISCDGSALSNITQSDTLTADVMFSAIQHRGNPDFVCDENPPVVSCETADNIFATAVVANNQGLRKNNTAILPERSVPAAAFGAPQSIGLP